MADAAVVIGEYFAAFNARTRLARRAAAERDLERAAA